MNRSSDNAFRAFNADIILICHSCQTSTQEASCHVHPDLQSLALRPAAERSLQLLPQHWPLALDANHALQDQQSAHIRHGLKERRWKEGVRDDIKNPEVQSGWWERVRQWIEISTLLQPSSSFVSPAEDGSEFTALSLYISEELLRNTDTKAPLLPP